MMSTSIDAGITSESRQRTPDASSSPGMAGRVLEET
jgi:hypothetical protein